METLALKYRPRAFSDLVGQKATRVSLQLMVQNQRVPTGMLFCGVRGTGKTTTGRIVAAALNCMAPADNEPPPCGTCPSCKAIADGTGLDVIEQDAASSGNVADIRSLIDKLRFSVGGTWRVVLLDEAHSMSNEAFNALLKSLEEPPPQTVFILLTTEPTRILETVRSRLMQFEFRQITTEDIRGRLEHICHLEGVDVAPDLLLRIAERAEGGMRDAVMTLDQCVRVGVKTLEGFNLLVGESDYSPALVRAMAKHDLTAVFEQLDEQLRRTGDLASISSTLVRTLREILTLQAGGQILKQGAALEDRRALAGLIDQAKVVASMRVLWDLKTKVRSSEDPRAALELAVVLLTETLGGTAAPTAAASSGKMSLAAMQQSTA